MLVVSTMDPKQLRPVKGLPALLSPFMLTSFKFTRLNHSVRAGQDPILQRIQHIARMDPTEYDDAIMEEFVSLVSEHCTFVSDWDDEVVTNNMLRVFGTRAAVDLAEQKMLNQIKASRTDVITADAEDTQLSSHSHGSWTLATPRVSRILDRSIKESREIHFFPGAIFEMTFNQRGQFSQSQLAILAEMPSREDVKNFADVKLLIAPEGCKSVPDRVADPYSLINEGWIEQSVGVAPERIHTVISGVRAKRRQYGFRHRIASTVHATMGNDVGKLVTSVSTTGQYRLWEKEQAVVLMSRTSFATDIVFVGDKDDTLRALRELITKRSQYGEYMAHLLDKLCGIAQHNSTFSGTTIDQSIHPFRPMDVMIPQDGGGYCYILLSLQDHSTTYIGQTNNLVRRFRQHNSGHGSMQTSDTNLRPWAILAYVCGFDENKGLMRRFEREWEMKRDNCLRNGRSMNPAQISDLARSVMEDWSVSGVPANLRYIRTGTVL